jgi:hypothetical protein
MLEHSGRRVSFLGALQDEMPTVMGILADAIPKPKIRALFDVWIIVGDEIYGHSSDANGLGHGGTDGEVAMMTGQGDYTLGANQGLHGSFSYVGEPKISPSIQ